MNLPTRGIGETTLNELVNEPKNQNISLWQASEQIIAQSALMLVR